MHASWPWLALLLLGGAHGINPAMGWLFAVGLGMQERDGRAVRRALLPLAAGHALAIGVVAALAAALGLVLPPRAVRWGAAAALLAMGAAQLVRHRHPRWGGMRVGPRDLAVWSFLMASAHGAGLMALPFLLEAGAPAAGAGEGAHAGHGAALAAALPALPSAGLAATALHTAGYLAVTAVVAIVVYERVGLRMLRRAWINLDLLWALALVGAAALTAPVWG